MKLRYVDVLDYGETGCQLQDADFSKCISQVLYYSFRNKL